jgi:hypothetical protein
MNAVEQCATAYHEASDAVIATLLGATIGNDFLCCKGARMDFRYARGSRRVLIQNPQTALRDQPRLDSLVFLFGLAAAPDG